MYTISVEPDGSCYCEGRVQDGTETWTKPNRREAVQSMIRFARVMNGTYITEKNIKIFESGGRQLPSTDEQLLHDIKCGKLVTVPHNDKRLRYGITDEECELIVKIREGDVTVVDGSAIEGG